MSAKIVRSEVLKSINKTMTVVEITREHGDKTGRVMFADIFGNVTTKRDFLNIPNMYLFIAEQMSLEHDWRCANPTA